MSLSRYDLAEAETRRRTLAALATHPPTGRYAALAVGPRHPLADVARTVERQIGAADFTAYEKSCLFLVVLDRRTDLPAGAGRVIDGGGRTLDVAPDLCGRDLHAIASAHELHDGGRIWDLAVLTARSAAATTLLHRTLLKAGRQAQVRHLVCMLDEPTYGALSLLGAMFEPMAGSDPFAHRGSPSTRALYHRFAELQPAVAEQSGRLREAGAEHRGEIRARGLRRVLARRAAARVAAQVATGAGLDEHILLPGLERRRLAHRR